MDVVQLQLVVSDVSGQHGGLIYKARDVRNDGSDALFPGTLVTNYQLTLDNMQEDQRPVHASTGTSADRS